MVNAFLGEVRPFCGLYAPYGWAICNGKPIPIAGNEALYSLILTTYGGDGVTTFGLPNLCGAVPIGVGMAPDDLTTRYVQGQAGGKDEVKLTAAEMPVHTHQMTASTDKATSATPGPSYGFASVRDQGLAYTDLTKGTKPDVPPTLYGNDAVSEEGDHEAHNNMMPSLVLSYIICLAGVYPELD